MSKPKAKRGRPKTLDRKQAISVAMRAYWSEDVESVSLNEICRRAELSKPGLYREFGNEDGLTKAVLVTYRKQFLAPVYQMIAAGAPFRETLDSLVSIVTRNGSAPMLNDDQEVPNGCLLVKMREAYRHLGEETRKEADHAKEKALTVYEDWVERAKAAGEFGEMSSRFAAIYIDAQLNNALSLLARGEPSDEVKKILTVAFSMLG
ncbi:MAG: TetR/AcrR family transcriptional regulator [Bacteroidota bacterium]